MVKRAVAEYFPRQQFSLGKHKSTEIFHMVIHHFFKWDALIRSENVIETFVI